MKNLGLILLSLVIQSFAYGAPVSGLMDNQEITINTSMSNGYIDKPVYALVKLRFWRQGYGPQSYSSGGGWVFLPNSDDRYLIKESDVTNCKQNGSAQNFNCSLPSIRITGAEINRMIAKIDRPEYVKVTIEVILMADLIGRDKELGNFDIWDSTSEFGPYQGTISYRPKNFTANITTELK